MGGSHVPIQRFRRRAVAALIDVWEKVTPEIKIYDFFLEFLTFRLLFFSCCFALGPLFVTSNIMNGNMNCDQIKKT
jgi:hypothetical protein